MTMTSAQITFKHVVAFEVSKQTLVVHVLPSERRHTVSNTPKAVGKLLAGEARRNEREKLGRLLVVCEATGGYERHVLEACVTLGLDCHLAHGKRVRDFANYLGVLAKTDPIDARVIALYGLKTEGLRLYQPPSPETSALKDLQNRRAEILDMLIAEGNRLEHARHPSVAKTLKAHIASLQKLRDALEAEIAALIKSSAAMARKASLMRSLKGVGPVTVATLLAHMPELGHLSKGEAAALAGLAPINRDSGKAQAPRHVVAGRSAVRRTLYMAAVVALQCNPVIKAFGRKLTKRGKPFKVVATAVMRKLLVTLNAILKSEKPWRMAEIA